MATHVLDFGEAPNVNPTGALGNDYLNIQASPDAFGASVGHAEQGLGQAETQAGVAGLDVITARQQLTNEVHSSDLSTWQTKATLGKFSDFQKLEGRAAQDALPKFQSDLDELRRQTMSQAGGPAEQAMVARSSAMVMDTFSKYAVEHADKQFRVWQDRSATERASTLGNVAALAASNADINGMDAHLSASDDEVRKKYEAAYYGPDEIAAEVAKNRGAKVAPIVQQMATTGTSGVPDLATANAIFKRYADQMDAGSRLAISKFLEPRLQKQSGTDLAHQAVGLGPLQVSAGDRDLMIRTIAGEAGGEGDVGKAGVASVIKNRVMNGGFGASVHDVIMAPKQFSVWNPGDPAGNIARKLDPNSPEYAHIGQIVDGVLSGRTVDPTGGAGHYYNPRDAAPDWGPKLALANDKTIGNHRFVGKLDTDPEFTQPGVDKASAIQDVLAKTRDDITVRNYALAEVNRLYATQGAATATARQALRIDVPNQLAAAEAGDPGAHIDEGAVRAAFPAPKAEAIIEQFAIAKKVGVAITGMQFGTPEEVHGAARDLASGTGNLSDMLKPHKRFATTGPGTLGAEPDDPADGAFFKAREHAQVIFQRTMEQRSKMLFGATADPSAYVQSEPTVAAAYKAMQADPVNLDKIVAYANATLGVQAHVGVPDDQQHVLTRGQAIDMAGKLTAAGTDVRDQLVGLQQRFGPHYERVFSDLVQLGKLPSSYQAIAALPDHDDANLLAKALHEGPGSGEKNSKQGWDELLPLATGSTTAKMDIERAVKADTTLGDYVQSLNRQGLSKDKIKEMVSDVQTLAFAKAYYNRMPPATAASSAVQAFTDQFVILPAGDARIPAAISESIMRAGDDMLNSLRKENVTAPKNIGGFAQASVENWLLDTYNKHSWINTPKADGIMLLDGTGKYVLDKQGKPLTVSFAEAGRPAGTRYGGLTFGNIGTSAFSGGM